MLEAAELEPSSGSPLCSGAVPQADNREAANKSIPGVASFKVRVFHFQEALRRKNR
jgi:hypothetical protein